MRDSRMSEAIVAARKLPLVALCIELTNSWLYSGDGSARYVYQVRGK